MASRVSIVIPVFNHERFIQECVDSVLAQDYPELEVIVVDDGSTDATPAILGGYGDRLRVLRQENSGAARALNRGLQAAHGDWVGWLSSDDAYLPGKIAAQLALAAARPAAGLLYTDWIMINAAGGELSRHVSDEPAATWALWRLLLGNFINGSSVLLRRDVLLRHGAFDEGLRADVDGEMWLRLLRAGVDFARAPGFFLRYRWHAQNMSHRRLLMRLSKDVTRMRVLREAPDSQLFPPSAPGGVRAAAQALCEALVRQECYGAAALAIERAVAAGQLARRWRYRVQVLRAMSSSRSEPFLATWRMAHGVAMRFGRAAATDDRPWG